jgi:hypothetical protein
MALLTVFILQICHSKYKHVHALVKQYYLRKHKQITQETLNVNMYFYHSAAQQLQTNKGNTNAHEILLGLDPMGPIATKLTCEEKVCFPLSTIRNSELPWKSELRSGPVSLGTP